MLDSFFQAFALLVRIDTYLYISAGLTIGMFVGAMPGLTTILAMSVLLPISFKLEPMLGIPFLIGIYKGGIYGGSIPAILVGIPGTGASIATTFDGPALTRKGQGRKALEMALFSSTIGDTLSDIFTLALIGPIAIVTLLIGPPEVFAVIIFSLVLIASVSSDSGLKGAIAACIGMGLGFIGTDATTGATRMTFDLEALSAGIPLIPLAIGIFAMPEVLEAVESRTVRFIKEHVDLAKAGERLRWHEFKASIRTIARSTAIGTGIGMVPGVGQVVAAFIGYSAAKRASKHPENFGKGELDGIAAPEAANNAVNGPTLVPLLTLGIPGRQRHRHSAGRVRGARNAAGTPDIFRNRARSCTPLSSPWCWRTCCSSSSATFCSSPSPAPFSSKRRISSPSSWRSPSWARSPRGRTRT